MIDYKVYELKNPTAEDFDMDNLPLLAISGPEILEGEDEATHLVVWVYPSGSVDNESWPAGEDFAELSSIVQEAKNPDPEVLEELHRIVPDEWDFFV